MVSSISGKNNVGKTKRALQWLEQFDEDDRPYANLLLKRYIGYLVMSLKKR